MARMQPSGEPATVTVAVFHGLQLRPQFATRLALLLRASGDRCCHGFSLRTADGLSPLRCWSGDAARLGREIGQTADAANIVVSGNICMLTQKKQGGWQDEDDRSARREPLGVARGMGGLGPTIKSSVHTHMHTLGERASGWLGVRPVSPA